jgi:hypothetical protein
MLTFHLRDLGLDRPFAHPVHWAGSYAAGSGGYSNPPRGDRGETQADLAPARVRAKGARKV